MSEFPPEHHYLLHQLYIDFLFQLMQDKRVRQEQMDRMVQTVQMVTKDRKEIKVKQEQQDLKHLL